jgi:hypothetical protein
LIASDPYVGLGESDLFKNQGHFRNGEALKVQKYLITGYEGLWSSPILDQQSSCRYGKSIRIKLDLVDRDLAMKVLRKLFCQYRLQNRRENEEANDGEDDEKYDHSD